MTSYAAKYRDINFREHPELYEIGRGEQGVLLAEPYKSEILPFWRFATPEAAQESAENIYDLFLEYKKQKDFVGMDMARKFLQMGFTRSRRYANHASGKKYAKDGPSSLLMMRAIIYIGLRSERLYILKILPKMMEEFL